MPTFPEIEIKATADQSNTAYSARFEQTYHSTHGAVAESKHVFIDGAGVHDRLRRGLPTRVLEIGFGLGLNCLLSSDCAAKYRTELTFVSVENDLISPAILEKLNYSPWLENPALTLDLAGVLQQQYKGAGTEHRLIYSGLLGEYTALELFSTNANKPAFAAALESRAAFHAIYLDAFSPDTNPECWSETFLHWLSSQLDSNGILATYSVKGAVRRALSSAGMNVRKLPGPPGKREVLQATLVHQSTPD